MDDEYELVEAEPVFADYARLRRISGLTPPPERASNGLGNAWFAVVVRHRPSGELIGMGRVISDGGWYFHIVDMAIDPRHQRRGLGNAVLAALLGRIDLAEPNAFVSLLADPPGRGLYARYGFKDTAPNSHGMARRTGTFPH